jgi:streptomycin 6-kinase
VVDPGVRERLTARYGGRVEPWLDALPGLLADLAREWRLEVGPAYPRGSMSAVHRCRLADGRAAAVKVSPDRDRLAVEAAALRGWDTPHSPRVLAADADRGALLLAAVEPGTPLAESGADPTAADLADLLAALHGTGRTDPAYPGLASRVAHLFDSSETLYQRHPDRAAAVPRALHDRGRRLAERLAADRRPAVLLHGDLTPANLLDGGPAGLVAIDPAACLGEAAFDTVDLVFWTAPDLPAIEARAAGLAAAADLDADRVLAWCAAFAAMCALELATGPDPDRGRVEALTALAHRA